MKKDLEDYLKLQRISLLAKYLDDEYCTDENRRLGVQWISELVGDVLTDMNYQKSGPTYNNKLST